jgi:hypothetical protein
MREVPRVSDIKERHLAEEGRRTAKRGENVK